MRAAWRRGELTAPPGGEEDADVLARFDAALARVLEHVGTGIACIVTHHGMLRARRDARGCRRRTTVIPNLGGFWFDVVDGALTNAEPLE